MARVATVLKRTSSATLDVGSLLTAASAVRRFRLYDLIVGSEQSTPVDGPIEFNVLRKTGAATGGSAPAIRLLDNNDTLASTLVANQAPTADGAGTDIIFSIPLNGRATFRWAAQPEGELISSIAASNGYGVDTPVATGLPLVSATLQALEY